MLICGVLISGQILQDGVEELCLMFHLVLLCENLIALWTEFVPLATAKVAWPRTGHLLLYI